MRIDAECVVAQVTALPCGLSDGVENPLSYVGCRAEEEEVLPDTSGVRTDADVRVEVVRTESFGARLPARETALLHLCVGVEGVETRHGDVDDLVPLGLGVVVLVCFVVE